MPGPLSYLKRCSDLQRPPRRRPAAAGHRRRALRYETLEARRLLASYFVDTTDDTSGGFCAADNPNQNDGCSIRSAIEAAGTNAGADSIEIPAGTYALDPDRGSLDVSVAEALRFVGDVNDPASVVIDGGSASRVLDIFATGSSYDVQLEGLTIQNGVAADSSGGGGINTGSDAHLILNAVVIQNNTAAEFVAGDPGGTFPSSGGGIQAAGDLTIANSVIRDNTATEDGGGIDFDPATDPKTLTVTATTFSDNSAASDGGAVAAANPETGVSTVTFNDVVIEQNSAGDDAGGLALDGPTITITGGRIDQNAAGDDGGGINAEGRLSVTNTSFDQNQAGRFGGAIIYEANLDNDFLTLSGTDLTANTAGIDGGGLYAEGGELSNINGSLDETTFDGNSVSDSGGGAFFIGMAVDVTSSSFVNNQAGLDADADGVGGGLYVRGDATTGDYSVTQSTFKQNSARGGGGGAFFVDADGESSSNTFDQNNVPGTGVTFENGGGALAIVGQSRTVDADIRATSITGNRAPAAGGLAVSDAEVTVTGSTITGNQTTQTAAGAGGIGVIDNQPVTGITLRVESSTVSDNITGGRGGGIGAANANLDIVGTRVENNQATGGLAGGVGIAGNIFELGTIPTATIRSSTLSGNSSSGSGGGFGVLNAGFVLENVTISGNTASNNGGGIASNNSDESAVRSIRFSTVASNIAETQGGNIAAEGSAIDLLSSLFADGDAAAAAGTFVSLGGNLDQSDTMGLDDPSDLVGVDPLLQPLADNGGSVPTRALTLGSPAIDAAASTSVPATDARGAARPQDGDGDSSALPDIGAFEADAVEPATLEVADVTVDEGAGTATVPITLNGTVTGGFTIEAVLQGLGGTVAPDDFLDTSPTLNFEGTDGETQTFDVTIIDDQVVEPLRQIEVLLQNPSAVSVDDSDTGQITINDDDIATLEIRDVTVTENDGSATVSVAVDHAVEGGFSVVVMTGASEASSTEDYVPTTQTLEFIGTAGETQSLVIPLIDDEITEPNETIDVVFAAEAAVQPNNPLIAASSIVANGVGRVTIVDDDTAPTKIVRGHLSCDANGNGREDAGEHVAGAEVFLDANRNGRRDEQERSTVTDSSGDYQFTDVNETFVSVIASVPPQCNSIPREPLIDRSTIGVGDLARSITHADVDGDNDLDLLVASDLSQSLSILENRGGDFVLRDEITLGDRPQSVFAWQPSDDSETPLIAVAGIGSAQNQSQGAIYHLQNGTVTKLAAGNGPIDVVLDDFDGDNAPDTLAAAFRSSNLNLHLGSRGTADPIATGRLVRAVATGDFNGDGERDIVFAGAGYEGDPTADVTLLLGDGSGEFSQPVGATAVRQLVSVLARDLDRDGKDEILALSQEGQLIAYSYTPAESTGLGTIQQTNRTDVTPGASSFDVGDFNRDGQIDVAVGNLGKQLVELLVGDGSGRFFPVTTARNVSAPSDLTVADLDGDQIDDIAVSNLYTDTSLGQDDSNPVFRLPSTTTILKVNGLEQSLRVSSDKVTQIDFVFASADPQHLLDVNGDRSVTARDALHVINHLNRSRRGEAESVNAPSPALSTDVNEDGKTTALDALLVINALNRQDISVLVDPSRLHDDDEKTPDTIAAAVDLLLTSELESLLA